MAPTEAVTVLKTRPVNQCHACVLRMVTVAAAICWHARGPGDQGSWHLLRMRSEEGVVPRSFRASAAKVTLDWDFLKSESIHRL